MSALAYTAPAGIGHNNPPLAEQLVDQTAELRQRAEDLAGSADRCAVTDEDTAGKAALLAKMIAEHRKKIEAERAATKEPYLKAGREVDQHFRALDHLLEGPAKTVVGQIDAYRRKMEAEAAAERRRLEEEARKAREEAAAAERSRQEEERARIAAEEEARRAGDAEAAAKAEAARRQAEVDAEIARRQAAEREAELQRQAATLKAAPIDSGYGVKASSRKVWTSKITDLRKATAHAIKVHPTAVEEAVQKILDRQIKAGVREWPGAEIVEDSTTVIR